MEGCSHGSLVDRESTLVFFCAEIRFDISSIHLITSSVALQTECLSPDGRACPKSTEVFHVPETPVGINFKTV